MILAKSPGLLSHARVLVHFSQVFMNFVLFTFFFFLRKSLCACFDKDSFMCIRFLGIRNPNSDILFLIGILYIIAYRKNATMWNTTVCVTNYHVAQLFLRAFCLCLECPDSASELHDDAISASLFPRIRLVLSWESAASSPRLRVLSCSTAPREISWLVSAVLLLTIEKPNQPLFSWFEPSHPSSFTNQCPWYRFSSRLA